MVIVNSKNKKDERKFPKSAFDEFMEDSESKKLYKKLEPQFRLEYQMAMALEGLGKDKTTLAKDLKINKSEVTRKLNGGISNATLPTVQKYAEALGQKFIPLLVPKDKEEEVRNAIAAILS